MPSSSVVIVSPALAQANNGNWQTARRWRALLGATHRVRIASTWPDERSAGDAVLLALHARRSAAAAAAWAQANGSRGLGVELTGTDLYRDLPQQEPSAHRSVELAQRLVVLQDQALLALPAALRHKTRVLYQSATQRLTLAKPQRSLRVAVVGHLRDVKSPQTVFEAARRLSPHARIRIDHFGAADADWAARARAAEAACPHYRWHGPVSHAAARRAIQAAHLLVHPSAMEGGAHVVMEAVCAGTPVLASAVPGNIGMLGSDYRGYFPHGDAAALAGLLERCRAEQAGGASPAAGLLSGLQAQCSRRAPLFSPDAERTGLLALVQELEDSR